MAKKKQNISITGPLSWLTIKTYLGGELSDKEMYNLERKIQNEPFEQEAFDGFYDHAPASMENDLNDLRSKIQRKTGNTLKTPKTVQFHINWRLVAGIAALVVLIPLVILLFMRRGDSGSEPVQHAETNETKQMDPVDVDNSTYNPVISDTGHVEVQVTTEPVASNISPIKSKQDLIRQKAETPEKEEMVNLEKQHLDEQRILALTEHKENVKSFEKNDINETIVGISDSSVRELAESPVTSSRKQERPVLSRIPARPPGGMEGYKAYLKSQLLSYSKSAKGTFIIKLTVGETGEVKNIVVSEGGNRRTNKRLQSIVLKAPAWMPASEKGKKIEDTASFKLILK